MKKVLIILCVGLLSYSVSAKDIIVGIDAAASIPVGSDYSQVYTPGGGSSLSLEWVKLLPETSLIFNGGYYGTPLKETGDLQHIGFLNSGLRYYYGLTKSISLFGDTRAGWYANSIDYKGSTYTGNALSFSASVGTVFKLTSSFTMETAVTYRGFSGLYNGLEFAIGTKIILPEFKPKVKTKSQPTLPEQEPSVPVFEPILLRGRDLSIENLEIRPVFPVYKNFYDENPIGTLKIMNKSTSTLSDITVSFEMKRIMDSPQIITRGISLKPKEALNLDILALFNEEILNITENTKSGYTLSFSYLKNSSEKYVNFNENTTVFHRNSMTWQDDESASCFVTTMDPAVLYLSKNVISSVNDKTLSGIDQNLQKAMALFIGFSNLGISYVIDPTTPYSEFSKNVSTVDFLQFPKQTIEFKAGDCDDLSILYSALLESVGVPAAFITVPGHIYTAVGLEISPDDVSKVFDRPDTLIIHENQVWLPIETTMINEGFLKAWDTGATEWIKYSDTNNANLLPIRKSWETYAPVQIPQEGIVRSELDFEEISSLFSNEIQKYVRQELYARTEDLKDRASRSQQPERLYNSLGILNARYGLTVDAQTWLEKAISENGSYVPALINLGNIAFMGKKFEKAIDYYEKAENIQPENKLIILGIARANHELENYGTVRKAYQKLKDISPDLAERFSYLTLRGTDAVRAADQADLQEVVLWEED